MRLTIEELEAWRGHSAPVTIQTPEVTVTGTYTGTIPAEPLARDRTVRRPRLIVRRGATVAYIRANEVTTITADGRRRPRTVT